MIYLDFCEIFCPQLLNLYFSDTPHSKFFMLDVIGDLALNKSFGQVTSGKEHQYVVDFNNAFMLIGLVSSPALHILGLSS